MMIHECSSCYQKGFDQFNIFFLETNLYNKVCGMESKIGIIFDKFTECLKSLTKENTTTLKIYQTNALELYLDINLQLYWSLKQIF